MEEKELTPVEMVTIYVCMFDDNNLLSMNNHAVGFLERPKDHRELAKFKEVALIDPDFIAMTEIGHVLVFEDMELIILSNPKSDMDEEELEDWGY